MRVVIAKDDALLREGLAMLLCSEGFDVVAAVDNANDFLALLNDADAAVLDVRMPPTFTNEGLKAGEGSPPTPSRIPRAGALGVC